MNDLMDWYNLQKEDKEVEPIIFAAEFHYRFILIHPFDDGNGRMARLLMNFILMQYGLPPVVVRTDDKENYFNVLQQADAGIHTPFIEYMAKGLLRSLEVMVKGAKGESIEEPNDIAKEIALLKQSLKQKNDKFELLLNQDTFNLWIEQSLPVILRQFKLMCEQFDGLYLEIVYYNGKYNYKANSTEILSKIFKPPFFKFVPKDVSKKDDFTTMQNSFISPMFYLDEFKFFSLDAFFNTFVFKGINTFDYSIKLKMLFEKSNYTILGEHSKRKISKLYHQTPTEEELAYIFNEEARLHLAFIKSQTVD
jgi:hypothetical protein